MGASMAKKTDKESKFKRCKTRVAKQFRSRGRSTKDAKAISFAICTNSVLKKNKKK